MNQEFYSTVWNLRLKNQPQISINLKAEPESKITIHENSKQPVLLEFENDDEMKKHIVDNFRGELVNKLFMLENLKDNEVAKEIKTTPVAIPLMMIVSFITFVVPFSKFASSGWAISSLFFFLSILLTAAIHYIALYYLRIVDKNRKSYRPSIIASIFLLCLSWTCAAIANGLALTVITAIIVVFIVFSWPARELRQCEILPIDCPSRGELNITYDSSTSRYSYEKTFIPLAYKWKENGFYVALFDQFPEESLIRELSLPDLRIVANELSRQIKGHSSSKHYIERFITGETITVEEACSDVSSLSTPIITIPAKNTSGMNQVYSRLQRLDISEATQRQAEVVFTMVSNDTYNIKDKVGFSYKLEAISDLTNLAMETKQYSSNGIMNKHNAILSNIEELIADMSKQCEHEYLLHVDNEVEDSIELFKKGDN